MSHFANPRDLVCLVADKDMEQSVMALLKRHQALGIRELDFEVHVHPERDPGCLVHSVDLLRSFLNRASFVMVIFDHEGCGQEKTSRENIEVKLTKDLSVSGWNDRVAVIVIDPELEAWVWNRSPHVSTALGWKDKSSDLRTWLETKGWVESSEVKPTRPKEAMESALRLTRKPRSSAIYRKLAETVSMKSCVDPAFGKFKSTLQSWFPPAP